MFKLSRLAAGDFRNIFEYTLIHFGVTKADDYTKALNAVLETLSAHPEIGISSEHLGERLKLHYYKRHAIYYRTEPFGLFVVRILHQQMNPDLHFS